MDFVFFDLKQEEWEDGLNFIRTTKVPNVGAVVVDFGLNQEQLEKLQQLSVTVLPNTKFTSNMQADIFNTLWPFAKEYPDSKFLFCKKDFSLDMFSSDKFSCGRAENDIARLVFPLTSFDNRVKLGDKIEKVTAGKFHSKFILGNSHWWASFSGFYNALLHTEIISSAMSSLDLVLNLFAVYFPKFIELSFTEQKNCI